MGAIFATAWVAVMTDGIDHSRLFWRLQIAGWITCALMGAAFGIVYFDLPDVLVAILPRTTFGFVATCGLRMLYRAVHLKAENIWTFGGAIFLLCGVIAVLDGAFMASAALFFRRNFNEGALHQFFVSSILMRWMVYWLWSVLYFGIKFWIKTERSKLLLARAEAEALSSELRFLQAQTKPHFLYNAFNTLLAESDNERTRTLVQALAEYLRFSARKHDEFEPLGEELDAIECYLKVEKARFEERFAYTVEAEEAARKFPVPLATVQPLVENAIKFGRRTSPTLLTLEVVARVTGEGLRVRVWNSGSWVPPGESGSTQTGLENLRRRFLLLYGGRGEVCISHDGNGVVAELFLPAGARTGNVGRGERELSD